MYVHPTGMNVSMLDSKLNNLFLSVARITVCVPGQDLELTLTVECHAMFRISTNLLVFYH